MKEAQANNIVFRRDKDNDEAKKPQDDLSDHYGLNTKSTTTSALEIEQKTRQLIPNKEEEQEANSSVQSNSLLEEDENGCEQKRIVQNDQRGNLIFRRGDTIDKYVIIKRLGEGEFARVVQVHNKQNQQLVRALKIVRNDERFRRAARAEVEVLEKVRQSRDDAHGKHLVIQLLGTFEFHGHICMMFDSYGQSVFEFMKVNMYHPYPMEQIRFIAYQLIHAVLFLHTQRIIHTDLKPENLIFVNSDKFRRVPRWCDPDPLWDGDGVGKKQRKRWVRVLEDASIKIIDLGGAVFEHQRHSNTVSTRHYRAPEIILQIGWSYPCDVFSIGAILFELYAGFPLFPKMGDLQHLAMIERIIQPFPLWMQQATRTGYFRRGNLLCDQKILQIVQKCAKKLELYIKVDEPEHRLLFDLIGQMLKIEPADRLPLSEARNHEFFDVLPLALRNKMLTGKN